MYIYLTQLLTKTHSILHSSRQHQRRLFRVTLLHTLSCEIHFKLQILVMILDWILSNNLHILNDGCAIKTSHTSGNDSLPHI